MVQYFRVATPEEKQEDNLDYRLTPEGNTAYIEWRREQRRKKETDSLTMFLVHTVFKLQSETTED